MALFLLTPASAATSQAPSGYDSLTAVTCPSSSACTAIGSVRLTDGSGTVLPLIENERGGKWSSYEPPVATIGAVACQSAASCFVTGVTAGGFAAVLHWNGSVWAKQALPSAPSFDGERPSANQLGGLACTASMCLTAGWDQYPGGQTPESSPQFTLAERWNGTKWVVLKTLNPGGTADQSENMFEAVTCQSATNCVATGEWTADHESPTSTLAESWNGSAWTVLPTVSP